MLVTPYYNKPNQRGMIAHFEAIANATTLPIVVYNIPGRSVVNMEADTMIALSKIPSIQIAKRSEWEFGSNDKNFSWYRGRFPRYIVEMMHLTLPLLALGGSGIISVASHVIGNDMQEMITSISGWKSTKGCENSSSDFTSYQRIVRTS